MENNLKIYARYGEGFLVQLNFYWPSDYPVLSACPQGLVLHSPADVGDMWTIEITDHGGLPDNYPIGKIMRFNPNCAWLESMTILENEHETTTSKD